jgi:LysR family cys regulon transcriptional activator
MRLVSFSPAGVKWNTPFRHPPQILLSDIVDAGRDAAELRAISDNSLCRGAMKLQQLRYIQEIYQSELNITSAAESLYTSQPGISRQLRKLEQELGINLFVRKGKLLTEITPAGRHIIAVAGEILEKSQRIKNIAREYRDNTVGTLSIGTTHNQARYALPDAIRQFMAQYPGIKLNIHQGTPSQIAEEASRGLVDMAISTEAIDQNEKLVVFPCNEWGRCILVPHGHPLSTTGATTLQDLADFPIVTYLSGFSGRFLIDKAFEKHRLHPQVVLAAADADVIKTYVRVGMGVGIVASMAYDPVADKDLIALDATHLFGLSVTKIGLRRDLFIREFMYEFIRLFAPRLTKEVIQQTMGKRRDEDMEDLLEEEE